MGATRFVVAMAQQVQDAARDGRLAKAFWPHGAATTLGLIGFAYAGWPTDSAADDFVGRLQEAGRRYSAKTGREAMIPIILDGENAWEHFEGGGRPFLRALYSRISGHPELRAVTMAEAATEPARTLPNASTNVENINGARNITARPVAFDHGNSQRFMNLVSRETDAVVLDHRLHHVVDQILDGRAGQRLPGYALRLHSQNRMSEVADLQN